MKIKVSALVARFLASKDVRHVFGIVGAGNAHLFDAIARMGETEIVCVHHEQAAVMAMQTYFRTSGVVTASLVTTGGGSTNALTGVVGAHMDSVPGLIISGNEHSRHTRPDNPLRIWGVQGYDSSGIVAGVTKWQTRIIDPTRVLHDLELAWRITQTGRPGPCWVDIPMDVQAAMVEEDDLLPFDPAALAPFVPPAPTLSAPAADQERRDAVAALAERLRQARRPVFWLGHGIRLAGAEKRLTALLERLPVPALVSWAGIDMIDSDHPLVYGRAGVYGQRSANFVLQNADLVVAIGTRLAIPQIGYDTSELARDARIVVIDIDRTELEKYPERFDQTIHADAGWAIDALLEAFADAPLPRPQPWIEQCDAYRREFPWIGPEHDDTAEFINSYRFIDRLNACLKPDQVIVTDMGTALLCGHQALRLRPPQRLMTSTGLGEMGYGLPGAIGASFARNRGEVMCLNCDGGMMMNLQELQTMVHHRLPIKLFIFNNDGYLMIKHTQKALFSGHYAGTNAGTGVTCPDFGRLAAAFGIPAWTIRDWADFDRAIPEVQAEDGPAICEVFMHPEQPFVPKLSLAVRADGGLVSPPLEDLSPLLPRDQLARAMTIGVHPKSETL